MYNAFNAFNGCAAPPTPGYTCRCQHQVKDLDYQFVDLSLLLARRTSQTYNIEMQNSQLTMVPKQKTFQLNMEQWNRAFNIYMSIYLEKCPEQAANMLQYVGHIQEMAQESGEAAAKYYDALFRKWKGNNSAAMECYQSKFTCKIFGGWVKK